MNYYFIFILFVIVLIAILILAIVYAIQDMKKISHKEIEKLTTGDQITIKTVSHGYITGRIVYLNKITGKGFLKPKNRHGMHFNVSQIKALA